MSYEGYWLWHPVQVLIDSSTFSNNTGATGGAIEVMPYLQLDFRLDTEAAFL